MGVHGSVHSPVAIGVHFPIGSIRKREAITGPPAKVAGVVPVDGATYIQLDQVVIWARPAMAQSYDVYIGPNAGALVKVGDGQAARLYVPTLALDSTYYIRIDSKNTFGTTTGDVTSFSTWASADIAFSDDGITPATDDNGDYVETPDT